MSENDCLKITEVIPNRLFLTSLYGMKGITNADIIVSILHFNPELNRFYPNSNCIYWNSQDDGEDKIEIYFDQFKQLMDENSGKIVYVHCLYGASRSVTIVASYLIHHIKNPKGNKISKILNYLRRQRSCIYPNDGFINKLKVYRKRIIDEFENLLEMISLSKRFSN